MIKMTQGLGYALDDAQRKNDNLTNKMKKKHEVYNQEHLKQKWEQKNMIYSQNN